MSKELSPLMDKKNSVHNNSNDNDNSDVDDIHTKLTTIRRSMQKTHESRVNFSYEWRKKQLTNLKTMVKDHWEEILDVLYQDLGKCRTEAAGAEMLAFQTEIDYLLTHTYRFMQPRDVPSSVAIAPSYSKITPQPRNGPAVLVIGPSNYPISINLMAVAGSLAAGNPTVLKPSEFCPSCAQFLSKYVPKYFDSNVLQVVEGGVAETTALLAHEWGLIHFTGSERVGKIVAAAGAKTLTPYVLELGGKCPCYVDETCHSLPQVADRIVWGKLLNCGQNCISPDYLVVHKSKVDALLPELKRTLEVQYGKDPKQSALGKLVAKSHIQRAIGLIEEVETLAKANNNEIQILCGGSKECDINKNYVAPTFVLNPPLDCRLMKEEIFSPILPIVVVSSQEEAVELINSRPGIPLGLYTYTNSDAIFQEMNQRCRSGSAVRNDNVVQFAGPHLPTGGLGSSGTGSYRGEYSLQTFSHMLPTVYRPLLPGADLNMARCQPYVGWKRFAVEHILPISPDIPVLKTFKKTVLAAAIVVVAVVVFANNNNENNSFIYSARAGLAIMLRTAAEAISP